MKSERDTCGGIFDVDVKRKDIEELDAKMAGEGFWDDQKTAQEVIAQSNNLKRVVNGLEDFKAKVDDARAMEELLEEEDVD